ncbi:MAG: hypothetical protein DBY37_05735 [Desulfovibrionaceae bacterium]|nr:MAG: hypothetical protein DBY37_05735 [Desulfovibrionaceae bacterium]
MYPRPARLLRVKLRFTRSKTLYHAAGESLHTPLPRRASAVRGVPGSSLQRAPRLSALDHGNG